MMAEVSTTDMGTPLLERSNPPILQMGMLGLDGPLRVAGTFSMKHLGFRVGRCSKPRAAWQKWALSVLNDVAGASSVFLGENGFRRRILSLFRGRAS